MVASSNVKTVKVSSRGAKRIRDGHLWVYRSDVSDATGVEGGAIARVVDQASNLVGQAFYSDISEIALRFLTTREETIDRDWWRARLRACVERRVSVARDTNAYRLIYSEGDLMPSLIIDKYDDVLVIQTLSQGTERLKAELSELLAQEFEPRAIVERNDARVRQLEGLEARIGAIYGEAPAEIEINQNGVRFFVSPLGGQKTGAFLDQRENYAAAERYARGAALDVFCYQGAFALHLARVCKQVIGIDASRPALEVAESNFDINRSSLVVSEIDWIEANAFDLLRDWSDTGRRFGTVVLDPPAFAKTKRALPTALRGYKEVNLRALKMIEAGGILVTCSCSHHVSREDFLAMLTQAARDAHRRIRLLELRGQSQDHPVIAGIPETAYLKCVIVYVE